MSADHAVLRTLPSGGQEFAAIVHWQHQRGGEAHCLARVYLSASGPPVAIISEIRSNPEGRGIASDLPAVAEVLLTKAPFAIEPAEVIWITHFGLFSYYDSYNPRDTFVSAPMSWDGHRYHDDLRNHRRMTETEVIAALGGAHPEPVPEVLARLGWRF